MPDWLRRAGHGRVADGSTVTWSVAEGSRGRRWREAVTAGQGSAIRSSLLLELEPDGRFSHLELSTAAGLLTLHPESDGSLHGNVVGSDGIRHIRGVPWQPDDVVEIEGSIVSAVAARARSAGGGVRIGLDLSITRTDRVALGPIAADALGLPELDSGTTWPLEEEA